MKATTLLQKQHRKVQAALKKLARGYDAAILASVATELTAHMIIEETTFYPSIVRADPNLILESYEEHALAQLALKRLLLTDRRDKRFKPRVIALSELVGHHIEEEEDTLFKRVEKTFDADMLADLGDALDEQFKMLVAKGYLSLLPVAAARTTSDRESSRLAP
jgi:hypothetical protein